MLLGLDTVLMPRDGCEYQALAVAPIELHWHGLRLSGLVARHGLGPGSFSGIFSESGESPRIICVAAPVSLKYQSDGSPS